MKAQYLSLWRSFVESSKYQIYISRSHDPFINLSVEHFLLQKSPPNSTILFLYVNRPCVVIGRNQNPWLEVDLKRLREDHSAQPPRNIRDKTEYPILTSVELVRRRSGGGTVFHDHGNVNYSVICPTANFTRDKHAEMVTKAIREINPRARVNGRHDIVLDQGGISDEKDWPDPNDMHRTAFHHSSEDSMPLKVSGSAYKMTRQRSLHHGTCLLASANIFSISQYLRSPASPFMKARGVESVRSPIGNVSDVPTKHFIREFRQRLIQSFATLYGIDREAPFRFPMKREGLRHSEGGECVSRWVDSNLKEIPEINDGIEELKVITLGHKDGESVIKDKFSHLSGSMDKRLNSRYRVILKRKMIERGHHYRMTFLHRYVQAAR